MEELGRWITVQFGEYSEEERCVKVSCMRLSLKQLTGLKGRPNVFESAGVVEVIE